MSKITLLLKIVVQIILNCILFLLDLNIFIRYIIICYKVIKNQSKKFYIEYLVTIENSYWHCIRNKIIILGDNVRILKLQMQLELLLWFNIIRQMSWDTVIALLEHIQYLLCYNIPRVLDRINALWLHMNYREYIDKYGEWYIKKLPNHLRWSRG